MAKKTPDIHVLKPDNPLLFIAGDPLLYPKSSPSKDANFWKNIVGSYYEASTLRHELLHEVGMFRNDESVSVVMVPPSTSPTKVTIKSTVINPRAAGDSPAYQATLRRRKAQNLRTKVIALVKWQEADGFCVYTAEVVEILRTAIKDLMSFEKEGNSRAIFRYIRDTFLDGGWERYREQAARHKVESVLSRLASEEEVTPIIAEECRKILIEANLQPFPIKNLFAENEAEANGEEAS